MEGAQEPVQGSLRVLSMQQKKVQYSRSRRSERTAARTKSTFCGLVADFSMRKWFYTAKVGSIQQE